MKSVFTSFSPIKTSQFREYIRINPENAEGHNTLGGALLERGNVDEALAEYREALRINPDYDEAHYNLGVALKDQGKLDEAIAEYREALRINPHNAKAYNNLGVALKEQGKLEETIAEYREALRINPHDVVLHNNLGVASRMRESWPRRLPNIAKRLALILASCRPTTIWESLCASKTIGLGPQGNFASSSGLSQAVPIRESGSSAHEAFWQTWKGLNRCDKQLPKRHLMQNRLNDQAAVFRHLLSFLLSQVWRCEH